MSPAPPSLLDLRLTQIRYAAQGISIYTFESTDGSLLPAFEAGAHVDLHVGNGLIRQYSLCSDPADRLRYELAVLHHPYGRGGSAAWRNLARCGETYKVSAPRNLFPLAADATDTLLLAAGIGVTPIVAMVYELERRQAPYTLHYCAKSTASMVFRPELEQRVVHGKVELHFSEGPQTHRLNLAELLATQTPGQHVYCCGPQRFIDAALAASAHWSPGFFHMERFSPAAPVAATGAATPGANKSFVVELARSGKRVSVAENVSIADALKAEGVDIPTSCEQGVCGMCQVGYLAGTPEHHDLVLLDEERMNQLMACCARSLTPELVLDL